MKPDFALSLTFDGITLLHRAAGGWRHVGDAGFDTPDLAAAVAELRASAKKLASGKLRTKLILPNEQIKYLSVETGDARGDIRDSLVREALAEATPYDLSELVYDTASDGRMTHVAAVARETLEEAEAFAVEHEMGPLAFVAIPGDEAFLGEPWFGQTKAATHEFGKNTVEPDGIAVVVVGKAVYPEPEPELVEAPEPEEKPSEEPSAKSEEPSAKDDPAPAGFSSRRARRESPAEESPATGELLTAERPRFSLAPGPVASGVAPEAENTPVAAEIAETVAENDEEVAEETAEAEVETDPVVTAPEYEEPDDEETEPDLTLTAPEFRTQPEEDPVPTATGFSAFLSRKREQEDPAVTARPKQTTSRIAPPPPAAMSEPGDEAAKMTVFGARDNKVGGKPRHLGLILTAGLLLFLAAVAIWASLFLDDGIAGLFGTDDAPSEHALTPAVVPAPDVLDTDPVVTAVEQSEGVFRPGAADTDTDPNAAPDTDVDHGPQIAAEPGAPEAPVADDSLQNLPDAPGLSETDMAVLDALDEGESDAIPADDLPAIDEDLPEIDSEMLDDEAIADAQDMETAPAADEDTADATALPAEPQTEAEKEARYAATGIWPEAPEAPASPAVIGLDDLFIASIDRTDMSQDAVALPQPEEFETDEAPDVVSSPAAAGTLFALDENGLVEATPEGTLNPEGVRIYAGLPPIRPSSIPERLDVQEEAESDALRDRLAELRPRLRPEDLAERQERTQLGGLTRDELATLRPKLRPRSLQEEAETLRAEQATPAPPSAQAVAASRRPDLRPADFASIVRTARAAPEEEDEPEPVAPVRVQPSIPSSASVARQATLDNAINLRRVNLIGVYGTPSNRRALVRLPSGRYKKVQVGDSVDGGRIVAIGDSELRYSKGGRNLTLKIPSG
ncbi:hypothetical protein [Phaeobacter sp. 22II1-1F12B]|uniref:hypothetical protein n=1 Tax=Phaeobacter sp. 22II1-1F12B TaxID=1317111 RepID=UPI000B743465|nr:hypothetical protein [Phaeobacter sp. 22II1-1F12B]OWU73120.1 hypothetical protein ATO1_21460 [Phaeobacter sp. 22II1-1F12B]